MYGLTAFSVLVCGGRRKGLVWFKVTTHLDTPPTMVGGVNERHVITVSVCGHTCFVINGQIDIVELYSSDFPSWRLLSSTVQGRLTASIIEWASGPR